MGGLIKHMPCLFSGMRSGSALIFCLALVACNVASSRNYQLDVTHGVRVSGVGTGCKTELGSYALPKTVIQVQIVQSGENFILKNFTAIPVPDNNHIYCLDHLRNAFAQDTVRVFKNKIDNINQAEDAKEFSTPFLQLIASRAVDHTAGIIRNIIRAVFIGISSNPEFDSARAASGTTTGSETIVADFKVDPFNYIEMAELNRSIRRFGFCMVLESYTFNRNSAGIDVDAYCNRPGRVAVDYPPPSAEAINNMRYFVPEKPVSGIYYRPRAPYQISVYVNHLPDHKRRWQLRLLETIKLENIMPIISVGIKRAVFATRRTGLVFNDGMLEQVCVSKGSEVEGFIEIPLDIVYGIIALPSEIVRATYDDAATRQALVARQNQLIQKQNEYIQFLNERGEKDEVPAAPEAVKVHKKAENIAQLSAVTTEGAEGPAANPGNSESLVTGDVLKDICPKLMAARPFGNLNGQF